MGGGGVFWAALTNCIVYYNNGRPGTENYDSVALAFSCTTPQPSGEGNVSGDPVLLGKSLRLANNSPCRGGGTSTVTVGVDLAGQPWGNPPSMGCYEWQSVPQTTPPQVSFTTEPVGFAISALAAGEEPLGLQWLRDGQPIAADGHYGSVNTPRLTANGVRFSDAGGYQLVVSNGFGMLTSAVAQVVVHCVDANAAAPVTPYTNWATAAATLQDAVNSAQDGEFILVTNGVYATGGKAMSGDLTNRMALDKALLVQSVNGPAATVIDGGSVTNSATAVRCVWMTNGTVLNGFTVRRGGTKLTFTPFSQEGYGGGIWGTSNNVSVLNCIIASNSAYYAGGGACGVSLVNCRLLGNRAIGSGMAGGGVANAGSGGGAAGCNLKNCILDGNSAIQTHAGGAQGCSLQNCFLTRNSAPLYGGAAYFSTLVNCTITGNTTGGYGTYGGAVASAMLTNCIVVGNSVKGNFAMPTNYYNCTMAFCDTIPLLAGPGNISVDPQLLADGLHLTAASACRNAGTNAVVAGTDLDGQPWGNPPSIGCDEWNPAPLVLLNPRFVLGAKRSEIVASVQAAGQEPITYFWLHDGTPVAAGSHYPVANSNLLVSGFGPADGGSWWVIASNAVGVATGLVSQLTVHCVNAANPNPTAPFLSWATAATNIQDAVDIAAAGEFVLVTNGIYASGGKTTDGTLTNRVVVDKALTVVSVNGPAVTTIKGAWDPVSTNGLAAVRGVWLADRTVLSGFTVSDGATLTSGYSDQQGGGISASRSATVSECVIRRNSAYFYGGGIVGGTVLNSLICENASVIYGGGSVGSYLANTTVVSNYARVGGGGVYQGTVTNSIVYFNSSVVASVANCFPGSSLTVRYSCTTPLFFGAGNISADPQLLDGYHIAVTSPCRGAGTNLASGVDLDGEPWANPPSMGCDEVWESALTGPLAVTASAAWPVVAAKGVLPLTGNVTGRATRVGWDFGDGTVLTNASLIYTSHGWTNPGNYTVTFTAFNMDHPSGVSATVPVQVVPLVTPTLTTGGLNRTNFTLSFPGQPGVTYVVQQTTNLVPPVTWQTLTTLTSTGQVMQVLDSNATNATRFYRTQVP
jgi:hypothetical protein